MTYTQNIIFALAQGLSELFPISSVAHGVILPWVLGWNLSPQFLKEHFLPYVVMLHLGTCLALLVYFAADWVDILSSCFRPEKRKTLWLLVAGTLPAACIGFVFEKPLRHLFSSVPSAAAFLVVNGILLYLGERLRGRGDKRLEELTFLQAMVVGLFQALALVPGFSRSGASITAGFWVGLRHAEAARFSMLLATPIILGATVLEVPKLFRSGMTELLLQSVTGGLVAGAAAFLSVTLLMRWFKSQEIDAMWPFSVYCVLVGGAVLLFG